jgi:hypothetical protein
MTGYYVIDARYGRILRTIVSAGRAKSMVRAGKAEMRGRRLYVTNDGEHHPMRTFTGNGLGGQCYVTHAGNGNVDGFRFIAPEDWPVFNQATINTGGTKCEFDPPAWKPEPG